MTEPIWRHPEIKKEIVSNGKTFVKCVYCGYEWVTKGKRLFIRCPSCLKENKRSELIK